MRRGGAQNEGVFTYFIVPFVKISLFFFSLLSDFPAFLILLLYFLLFWLSLDKLNRLSSSVNSTELLFMCFHFSFLQNFTHNAFGFVGHTKVPGSPICTLFVILFPVQYMEKRFALEISLIKLAEYKNPPRVEEKSIGNLNVHSLLILKTGKGKKSAKGKLGKRLKSWNASSPQMSQVSSHRKNIFFF